MRALKGAAQIPGVRIWAERTIAATALSVLPETPRAAQAEAARRRPA